MVLQGWEGTRLCNLKCKIIFAFNILTPGEASVFPVSKSFTQHSWWVRQGAASGAEPAAAVQPFQAEGVKAEGCEVPWDITQPKPHTETACKTSRLFLTDVSLTLS